MEIETIPIENLNPYENNPRLNDEAVPLVAESIREFGFLVPLVVDADNVVVAGHTRLKAAQSLGLTEVPCIRASHLTPEQVKAFRLADNRTAEEAMWDVDALFSELEGLDLVLDLFGGSGSTLMACQQTGRRCNMMELNPYFCDVIVARWEKFTGLKAERVTP